MNQVCPTHSCFSSLPPLIRASVSLPEKSGFAAACVNKNLGWSFCTPKALWSPGTNQHGGCWEAATFQKEKEPLGQCWCLQPLTQASLEGTCGKHRQLLGSQEIPGGFVPSHP